MIRFKRGYPSPVDHIHTTLVHIHATVDSGLWV